MAKKVYKLESKSPASRGTNIYVLSDVVAPMMYLPRIRFSAEQNKAGSQINVMISSNYPLAREVDGRWSAPVSYKCSTKLNIPTNVLAPAEAGALLDTHIQFLQDQKELILKGIVNNPEGEK